MTQQNVTFVVTVNSATIPDKFIVVDIVIIVVGVTTVKSGQSGLAVLVTHRLSVRFLIASHS